ncbi:MAG: YceI family protein, partial [candidate division Zixibacteria bacterium]|nr:YceI family protein [candidate division Zixibacteria bacterium]
MKRLGVWLCFVSLLPVAAPAADYGINSGSNEDTVHFRSPAKLEFIEGSTNNLTGGFTVDPHKTESGVRGLFQVDLRTLKTGIDMRDEHMRERHLQTDTFPFAYFSISSVKGLPSELKADSLYSIGGDVEFFIHGVKRSIPISVEVRRSVEQNREAIKVTATFSLKLDDFGIPRPKALFL